MQWTNICAWQAWYSWRLIIRRNRCPADRPPRSPCNQPAPNQRPKMQVHRALVPGGKRLSSARPALVRPPCSTPPTFFSPFFVSLPETTSSVNCSDSNIPPDKYSWSASLLLRCSFVKVLFPCSHTFRAPCAKSQSLWHNPNRLESAHNDLQHQTSTVKRSHLETSGDRLLLLFSVITASWTSSSAYSRLKSWWN